MDSSTRAFQAKLVVCRELIDSLRLFEDLDAGRLAYQRLEAGYGQAKTLLARLERLAASSAGRG